jgi:hypothetical protein
MPYTKAMLAAIESPYKAENHPTVSSIAFHPNNDVPPIAANSAWRKTVCGDPPLGDGSVMNWL